MSFSAFRKIRLPSGAPSCRRLPCPCANTCEDQSVAGEAPKAVRTGRLAAAEEEPPAAANRTPAGNVGPKPRRQAHGELLCPSRGLAEMWPLQRRNPPQYLRTPAACCAYSRPEGTSTAETTAGQDLRHRRRHLNRGRCRKHSRQHSRPPLPPGKPGAAVRTQSSHSSEEQ